MQIPILSAAKSPSENWLCTYLNLIQHSAEITLLLETISKSVSQNLLFCCIPCHTPMCMWNVLLQRLLPHGRIYTPYPNALSTVWYKLRTDAEWAKTSQQIRSHEKKALSFVFDASWKPRKMLHSHPNAPNGYFFLSTFFFFYSFKC